MSTKMLCTPAHTRFLLPSSLPLKLIKLKQPQQQQQQQQQHLFNNRRNSSSTPTTIKMSSFIEHIVLFKVKPNIDQTKVNSMVNALNNLTSLNLTLHLTSGQLRKSNPNSNGLTFTHMLHSRYNTVDDLKSYAVHPEHVRVVNENVKPVCDDIMAVDWRSEGVGAGVIEPGKAMRVSFVKLKENVTEGDKSKVLEVIRGVKDQFGGFIQELSVGENFSERAKGYEIASVAVFNGVEEMEKMDQDVEKVTREKEKVKEFVQSVVVVDYVVPVATHQSANL